MVSLKDKADLKQRVRMNVTVDAVTGCWNWNGAVTGGYGLLEVQGRRVLARRLAYQAYGVRPPLNGFRIEVTCKNRLCVNPEHLRAGRLKGGVTVGHCNPGSSGKYPWDEWFSRTKIRLIRGIHFSGQPHGLAQQARGAAHERGLRLQIRIQGDKLDINVRKGR